MKGIERPKARASKVDGHRPLVSIVTPVLNRVATIGSSLASVSAQTYPNVEHIVVDGGSTDGTLDVIRSFDSRHDFRWISGPDKGMYDAINKGLNLASGDILAYVNSDDFYLPWTIEAAVETFDEGTDMIFGDLGILQVKDEDRSFFFIQFYPPFDLAYYTHVGTLGQPTVFWRRNVTDAIGGFDESYKLIGDCEYWIRAAASGARLRHIHEVLAIQIDHGDTLRATHPVQLSEEFTRMREAYSPKVPPPRHPAWSGRKKSLRWRWSQLALTYEARRSNPKRWPRFISFLRDYELEINRPVRAVASLLPARYRPDWAMKMDQGLFEEKLLEAIEVDAAT